MSINYYPSEADDDAAFDTQDERADEGRRAAYHRAYMAAPDPRDPDHPDKEDFGL